MYDIILKNKVSIDFVTSHSDSSPSSYIKQVRDVGQSASLSWASVFLIVN